MRSEELKARLEPFDTFWEGPEDVEKGYAAFLKFYKHNYFQHLPGNLNARALIISCGPGYFMNMMRLNGYGNVTGIDSSPEKLKYAERKKLNCHHRRAFEYLQQNIEKEAEKFDLIVAEQEINHLTKEEVLCFLSLCRDNLNEGGTLLIHSLNGANPLIGAEAITQNFDHYAIYTEYSLKQILAYTSFREIKVYPLNLYVFYLNPLNYAAMLAETLNRIYFKINFKLYGKSNKIFSKKILAVCRK